MEVTEKRCLGSVRWRERGHLGERGAMGTLPRERREGNART